MVSAARKTRFCEISLTKNHSRLVFRFFPRPSPTLVDSQTPGGPSGPNLGTVRGDSLFCWFSLARLGVLGVWPLKKREFPGYRPPKSTPGWFSDFSRVREALRATQKHHRTTLEAPTNPFAVSPFSGFPVPRPGRDPRISRSEISKISRNMQIPKYRSDFLLRLVRKLKRANFGGHPACYSICILRSLGYTLTKTLE